MLPNNEMLTSATKETTEVAFDPTLLKRFMTGWNAMSVICAWDKQFPIVPPEEMWICLEQDAGLWH